MNGFEINMAKKVKGTSATLHLNDSKKTVDTFTHVFSGTTIKEIQKELKVMTKEIQSRSIPMKRNVENTYWLQGNFVLNGVTYQIDDVNIIPDIPNLTFDDRKRDEEIKIITALIPKISEEDAEELLIIKSINETSQPEDFSEMKQSAKDAKFFWKKLDKFPLLKELGFDESDVYDYTQD